jgi:hypothetical protein
MAADLLLAGACSASAEAKMGPSEENPSCLDTAYAKSKLALNALLLGSEGKPHIELHPTCA